MNTVMWNKPTFSRICKPLNPGCGIIDPIDGALACGEEGTGAMASPEVIIDHISP